MRSRDYDREIYSITVALKERAFYASRGQLFSSMGIRITCIELDENEWMEKGIDRYNIWAIKLDSEKEFIWKYFKNASVEVTNDI